jgi:alpha-beta hydrolase superfamily lysophospholipase
MEWLPDDGDVKAVLQISHGITEHIGRYGAFARFMTGCGFAVIGNSHLGHGRTAATEDALGLFPEQDGWLTAVRDLRIVYDHARARYPGLPYFLLGHSMGSFLARTFMILYPEALTGCVLSGTGQQNACLIRAGLMLSAAEIRLFGPAYRSARVNLLCFGAYNRRIKPRRTPCDWLTRDNELAGRFLADNTCGFVPSVGMLSNMLCGIHFVGARRHVEKMRKNLPLLLISGDQDPVGDYGAGVRKVARLWERAGIRDVTMKLYPGARHELLNETNRLEVYGDILAWLNEKMRG